jgi:GNAT superfamily N-acetyltransferase
MGERAAYTCLEVGRGPAADPRDLADLARLRSDWTVAQGGSAAAGFEAELRAWWLADAGDRRAWLARDRDGVAVGMANVQVFHRMPRPGRVAGRWAYVANVWVDGAHRRRGVGADLMRAVVGWCRAQGMDRVVLNPSEMSVPMYRSLGFRPADDLMRLDL